MEIHHAAVEKKTFKEYLLEGLMIFIAVTMGFFAENIREHFENSQQQKEYSVSLKEDLKIDTLNLSAAMITLQQKAAQLDSLIILLNKPNPDSSDLQNMYFFARNATRKNTFHTTDRTVVELKNSGAFRLLTNNALIENMMDYEQQEDHYNMNASNDLQERALLYPFISKIFYADVFQTMVDENDGSISKPHGKISLKKSDKDFTDQFKYYLHQLKSSFLVEKTIMLNLKQKAISIIQLIDEKH